MDDTAGLSAADEQSAALDPVALLILVAGQPNPDLSQRVRRVLEYARHERVHVDAPPSPEDEVLTLEFQHIFTREQVAQILAALPS
jgi:hypothetical protein